MVALVRPRTGERVRTTGEHSRAMAAGSRTTTAGSCPNPIVDGPVRFSVITPTLVRAEYAVNNAFTDAGTFTAIARPLATSGCTYVGGKR